MILHHYSSRGDEQSVEVIRILRDVVITEAEACQGRGGKQGVEVKGATPLLKQ